MVVENQPKILLNEIEPLLEAQHRAVLSHALADQRPSDIAEIVELVDNEKRRLIFDALDAETAGEVLEKVDEATRSELGDLLSPREIGAMVAELDHDDAADVLAELPDDVSEEVLQALGPDESAKIRRLMSYSEDSAGGIMDPLLIKVPLTATVAEAVEKMRAAEIDQDFYCVYVVDEQDRLVGDVRLRLLLTQPKETPIVDLMDRDVIYVHASDDQETVRNVFSKNDLIVVPVVDPQHRLIGRITADRIIEVAEEEAAEDLYSMAGTDPEELDSFSVINAARIRMTWLLPCLCGTAVTAMVMIFFKHYNQLVFLAAAAFAPMIQAMSGNAGLQTSAIVVSGLATGRLAALRFAQVCTREVRIALLVALCCGILGGVACGMLLVARAPDASTNVLRLASAMVIAMFSAIMVSTTLGLLLPFLFRRIGIDPAISSGPLVTTANDSISVTIYMLLAIALAG
ncbi:MAG TPA: magnesium transporter [Phycisphaerales bacterium]|nr:magnesium transporter [Phycisphaerales bacterium]